MRAAFQVDRQAVDFGEDFICKLEVDVDAFLNIHAQSPEHDSDNAESVSPRLLRGHNHDLTLPCWSHISYRSTRMV